MALAWSLVLAIAHPGESAGRELLANGSFEGTLSGWAGERATLSLVSGGAIGSQAARVTEAGSAFGIVTSPAPVRPSAAGVEYAANAFVRSSLANRQICLQIRELSSSSSVVGSAQSCRVATSGWARFDEVRYVSRGGASLEVRMYQATARKRGDRFDVDGVSLLDLSQDTTPPETTIDSGPASTTSETTATFQFRSSEPGSTFQCRLDASTWAACTSPRQYSGLAAGAHRFEVRAIDPAGNVDATPAVWEWTVVVPGPAPDTAIASGPSGTVRTNSPTFAFTSDRAAATFECSLDGSAWAACTSPRTVHVGAGRHTFRVRAVDGGTVDPTPAERTWWSDGLVQNGNFEMPVEGWARQGTYEVAGWKGYNASLSVVAGGVAGPGAGRVTRSSGDYSAYTSPKPVNSSVAGRTYVATGWTRSVTPGKTVCLRIREFNGPWEFSDRKIVGGAQSCLTTTSSWQAFAPVSYQASRDGNEIEVLVYQATPGAEGDSFDVDGIALDDGTPDPVLPEHAGDPVLLATADVASCWSSGDESVARLLDTTPGVIAIAGDTEQNYGSAEEYRDCYDPAWGRHKHRTRPAVGDHEYRTPGAAGYFDYYGPSVGEPNKGWYSYDLGDWHIVVLNSNCTIVPCGPGSEQLEWLERDLAANAKDCTAAYFHHPRWSSGQLHGDQRQVAPFWDVLYKYAVDFVWGGNDHTYQRYAKQNPAGQADPRGIRQFVVGTGGTMHYKLGTARPNLEVMHTGTFGVLKLTLRSGSYHWQFLPQEGKTFTDSGSTACNPLPGGGGGGDTTPPTVALTAPADGATVSGTVTLSADASDNVGVSRVEFLVNGAVVGTATSAPYSVSWDSRTVANGQATIRARATDTAGNTALSDPRSVSVQNAGDPPPAPETTIDSGPSSPTTSTSATFAFSSNVSGATFECSLDGAAWAACTSPHSYSGLAPGEHTFRVRAVSGGTADATPAAWTWTIQEEQPPPSGENLLPNGSFEGTLDGWYGHRATLTLVGEAADGQHAARVAADGAQSYSIVTAPRPVSPTDAGAVFRAAAAVRTATAAGKTFCVRVREFASNGSQLGTAQSCVVASAGWTRVPELSYTAVGGHSLDLYAYQAGTVASGDSFDLDAVVLTRSGGGGGGGEPVPPETTIHSGPSSPTTETSATFSFGSDTAGSTFECSLDDGAWVPCSSPRTVSGLAVGDHVFRVRAIGPAGTPDPTPAEWRWTVQAPPPPPPSSNLLANGSFESGLDGWYGYRASVSLVGDAADGAQAARVAASGTSSYSLVTSPRPVSPTEAGTVFRTSASLRSASAVGKTFCLRVREYSSSGALLGSAQSCLAATASWARFPEVSYTAVGGHSLDLYVYQSTATASGDSFDVDAIVLTR
ncbi:MAG TPA: Ig-like domain-containing protein [Gaiellaceae bacterium]|nr:Ig-like domain-containing protein [Gaiellaceae bacterium]